MKKYRLAVTDNVWDSLSKISNYITSVASESLALKYTDQLLDEIRELSNPLPANAMQYSQWQTAKQLHPKAKRLITKNRKWNIIFHIDGQFVVIDGIIATSNIH